VRAGWPRVIDAVILLTGPVEQNALAAVLRRHNPHVTICPAASLDELQAIDAALLWRARLIGFTTPVVVPPRILKALGFGAYNFHPGPPHYPGWAPAQFAIYDKAETFGATVHRMVEKVDAGPIVAVELFAIPPGIGVRHLQELAFLQAARLFWRLAPALAMRREPLAELPVQWSGTKSTSRMHKTMCEIDLNISREELDRRIGAFGAGDFGVDPTVTLHGHKFRYVAPSAESQAVPATPAPAALVA